ncbi:MAG TPA: sigma-70 family RNA polymerase sigma factor [Candidatus Saccharimonadales bacterium]|nr:sigma-70 family RNA polymerase sigma factor [Candidatus Saccharimonadales bacterium]
MVMQIDSPESVNADEPRPLPLRNPDPYPGAFAQYMIDVGQTERLNSEQETELAISFQEGRLARDVMGLYNGVNALLSSLGLVALIPEPKLTPVIDAGKEARDRLIADNIMFVVSRAKRHQGRNLPLVDIIQNGNIGLMRAVEKFDPKKGARLMTYARFWIDETIKRGFTEQARVVYLPLEVSNSHAKVHAIRGKLYQELEREPTIEEIAEMAVEKPADVEELLKIQAPTSYDTPREDGTLRANNLSDREQLGTEEQAIWAADQQVDRQRDQKIKEELYARAGLTKREREIVELCFRPDESGKQPSQSEVAIQIGKTRQLVSKVLISAISKLQTASQPKE